MDNFKIKCNFLSFFEKKGHRILPSASVVNAEDPQLLFVNAGMNPFKDYFLGNSKPPALRVANSQRCLRVSGKHNDLEEVGFDTYHHTFFEMLGNWSFGDYFKEEAIAWAWEFLVTRMGLPQDCLYATVFAGDADEGLQKDTESAALWAEVLPTERILFFGKGDNFWEMGATGPCGPCTELHIDLRSEAQRKAQPSAALINRSHPEVIELWNLVFMQYDRSAEGGLRPLSLQHVDTGMGFERLCMVLQEKHSAYDTDIFQPLLAQIASQTNQPYKSDTKAGVAFRVIADHIRAVVFAMADGALPGPARAGYVLRRLLRRALRYGHTFLGCRDPFLYTLLPILVKQYEKTCPELKAQESLLNTLIQEEERMFLRTMEKGLCRLEGLMKKLPQGATLSGEAAFELYDTYGFPWDLTRLIVKEHGFSINEEGYAKALGAQRTRSQQAAQQQEEDWVLLAPEDSPHSEFVGYDHLEIETKLLRYRSISNKEGTYYELVLERTPFYPEGGGQIGDRGRLYVGEEEIKVLDTQKVHALIVHKVQKLPAQLKAPLRAWVDSAARLKTQSNHTATHLLHAALRQVLGAHVAQRGSRVGPEGLRFDFTHYDRISAQELQDVEQMVNEKICNNIPLQEERNVPLAKAKARGARALFGEKYGEKVRLITFGADFSVELCGGTHVPATGCIGLCKLLGERAVAAGVRRIEALTSAAALQEIQTQQARLEEVRTLLKHPKDLKQALEQQLKVQKSLQARLSTYEAHMLAQQQQQLKSQVQRKGPLHILVAKISVTEAGQLRSLSFALGKEVASLCAVLATEVAQKPYVAVFVDKEVSSAHQIRADELCRHLATHIAGHGGGQPFFAMAGGKKSKGIPNMLTEAKSFLEARALS